jgi:hypothetical protein
LIGVEQRAVLAQFGGVGAQGRQAGLVGLAQLCAVAHRVEVADRAPGGAQAVVQFVHGQHQAGPGRVVALLFEDLGNGFTVVGQDRFDRRQHVFGTDEKGGRSWDCRSGLFALTVRIPWQEKH